MRARLVLAAVGALAVLAVAGSAAAAPQTASSGQAFGVRVTVPGGQGGGAAFVSAPPEAAASAPSFAYGDGVATGAVSSSSTASAGVSATASSAATAADVSLFGGQITVDSLSVKARAGASANGADGSLARSSLTGVTILGEPVAAAPNARVELGDWGYAVLLEQGVVRRSDSRFGYRCFVTGLHVVLTAEHGGLPAGSEISIGYAEAAASASKPAPPPPPPPPPPPAPPPGPPAPSPAPPPPADDEPGPPTQPKSPQPPSPPPAAPQENRSPPRSPAGKPPPREPLPLPPGAHPEPPPVVKAPPADVKPQLTAGGYVFPVYGPASFGDDFAAARAFTGWHHGNDIFAPLGSPVLAVTDGTLFLVGWNDVGGNRLWLRDDRGNEFYYAHLSAFAPVAQEGARVRAGDVIGFVGTTGDAAGTPPHLHFEIHPRALLWMGYDGVVDPYPYLSAWRRLVDVAFGDWSPAPGEAPPPGAVLLQADDVSTLSSLGDDSLAELVAPQTLAEAPAQPEIVGAAPAFGA